MMGYGGYPTGSENMQGQNNGGFQNSPYGNDGSQGAGGSQKAKAAASLRPVSVKQIMEATSHFADSPLLVDGKELTQIVIVGRVNKVNITATAILYSLDDGSGTIDVKKYTEQNEDENMGPSIDSIQEGGYLKVIGRVKVFNSKRSIDAHKIISVTSVDEICHHILSICFTHLSITKPKPSARSGNAGHVDGGAFTGAAFGISNGFSMDANLSPIQQQILSMFQQYAHTTEGGDISDVVFALRGSATADQIRSEIENLCAEGQLYSTLDENHFKLTGQ